MVTVAQNTILPNFFIVGAARAGTTSLYRTLQQHPGVFMPEFKEPNYFCSPTPGWERWEVPASRERNAYLDLFAGAGGYDAIGEASVAYLTDPDSAARIRTFNPAARVIVMLRHPADRAYSMYRYMCMRGFERMPTFERALADEHRRVAARREQPVPPLYAGCYFESGLYATQVERFLTAFPPDQVLVVLFDDFKLRPVEVTREVYRFLGLDASFTPTAMHRNASPFVMSVAAQHFLARQWRLHPASGGGEVRPFVDRRLITMGFLLNAHLGRLRGTRMKPETRRRLTERYRDDIRRTADIIGQDLDRWLAGSRP